MAKLSRAVSRPDGVARKAEREWQRLCDVYLPIRPKRSIWRCSRKHRQDDPPQGWKIHISATILSARSIFRVIAPYLKRRGILFKAPKSLLELQNLNAGIFYGFSQMGKFITIYPPSTEVALAIAPNLHRLTAKHSGPLVPYDKQLRSKSCVYYRYGSFSNVRVIFRGKRVDAISRPDGKLVPDLRKAGAAVPRWLTDPFTPAESRTELEPVTPLETDYTDYEALIQRGRGGIYQARDVSSVPARPCVIKEGRRHGETDWLGRDGFDRIKRETQFLRSTSAVVPALPRIITSFRANGCFYLVMERIVGRTLQQMLASRRRISRRRMLNYCVSMAQIVADIHAAGWAWRDCKPANFLCQKNGKLRALDFEGACRLHAMDPLLLRTSGYTPAGWRRKLIDPEAIDLYALGTSIMQVVGRSSSLNKLSSAFERETKKHKFPSSFVKTIRSLRNAKSKVRPSARAAHFGLAKP